MSIRPIQLPNDLERIVDLITHGFQYPENPVWSLQADQVENMVSTMKAARRLWPLIWIAQRVSLHWRNYLCGNLWEANGQPVGVCVFSRQGAVWHIIYLTVLPEYRRKGIAWQLLRTTLDEIQACGGKRVVLDVLSGNFPANTLFERLGFRKYSGYIEYFYEAQEILAVCPLPEGYSVLQLGISDWRTLYELEQQIIPSAVQQFEPVDSSNYRSQVSIHRVTAIIEKVSGIQRERLIIRSIDNEQTVAYGMYTARRRPGGINTILMELNPAHGELAAFLVRHLTHTVQQVSPERRIEFLLPEWQGELMQAVQRLGNVQSVPYHQLGLFL